MHILITDSGVGGLSVLAYAEQWVRERGVAGPVRLTFANAAPANDAGYNAMPSREVKLAAFDRFLRSVTERFAPDSIYVACNTLSVLLPDTPFARSGRAAVRGIVDTAADLLAAGLEADPAAEAIVFGTQTTIEAETYPRLLERRGIDRARVVSQACPGLADVISEDREGSRSASEISRWVGEALAKVRRAGAPVVACLACTHYGYRRDLFSAAFEARGIGATVIDPNRNAVGDLFPPGSVGRDREASVEVVTRYAIPEATVEALESFLGGVSEKTVAAMRSFVHVPDLF